MSCLYSSPELLALDCRCQSRFARCARITRTQSQRSSIPDKFLTYVAVSKDAFPSNPAHAAGCTKSFSLPKQAQVSRVSFQAQYQAFVRFAVGSSAAL
jgi:hypothetical protein